MKGREAVFFVAHIEGTVVYHFGILPLVADKRIFLTQPVFYFALSTAFFTAAVAPYGAVAQVHHGQRAVNEHTGGDRLFK